MNTGLTVVIDNLNLLGTLCGPNDQNLEELSAIFSSPVRTRGNEIVFESSDDELRLIFRNLMDRLKEIALKEDVVTKNQIHSIFSSLESGEDSDIKTFRESIIKISGGIKRVYPRNNKQSEYIRFMSSHDLIFSTGPAGTGKTYLAVAHALMELMSGKKRKIILTRPVVETGENLGFLPGDLTQKLSPYLRPLYDAMEDLIEPETFEKLMENGRIEVAPLAYMRGRSMKNCYIVLDEAQNTTIEQMKMFLTRLGEGSRAVVTGDLTQIDLASPEKSGLSNAIKILKGIEDIAVTEFTSADVVRHPLVKKIIDAYEKNK